jgi:tRNA(fMet)-specific endonuclease VapC
MNGSLLDTNVIVKVLRNDSAATAFLDGLYNPIVPVVVIGELLYGANKSSKRAKNIEIVNKLIEGTTILSVDHEVAKVYADIKASLQTTGYAIPENDLWIAAIAQRNGLPVVTCDKHFKYISTISVIEMPV